MIFVSILVFIIVIVDFVRDSAGILRGYPTLNQIYGRKNAIKKMWLNILFWLMELIILISVLVWWLF